MSYLPDGNSSFFILHFLVLHFLIAKIQQIKFVWSGYVSLSRVYSCIVEFCRYYY